MKLILLKILRSWWFWERCLSGRFKKIFADFCGYLFTERLIKPLYFFCGYKCCHICLYILTFLYMYIHTLYIPYIYTLYTHIYVNTNINCVCHDEMSMEIYIHGKMILFLDWNIVRIFLNLISHMPPWVITIYITFKVLSDEIVV